MALIKPALGNMDEPVQFYREPGRWEDDEGILRLRGELGLLVEALDMLRKHLAQWGRLRLERPASMFVLQQQCYARGR